MNKSRSFSLLSNPANSIGALMNNPDYQELSEAIATKRLTIINIVSIPGSRSTLLNFALGGSNITETKDKVIPLHEPFIQGGDPFTKIHADKSPYDIYAIALKRVNAAYRELSNKKEVVGLTIKDHCKCFTTGSAHLIDKEMFFQYMKLANAGIILTIREPIAVFNNRFRALLNFKLTEKGGLHSEKFFKAFFENDCKVAHNEILQLFNKENSPIDKNRLLKELGKNSVEAITAKDWEDFRARFLKEKAYAFRLSWTKAREVYETLKARGFNVFIVNTSEMCKEPETYLKMVMQNIQGAEFHSDMINNIPAKTFPYPYDYAGKEYGYERIFNIFLKNSLSSKVIQQGLEKSIDPSRLPKEILETLEFVNGIYNHLNSQALTHSPTLRSKL